MCSDSPHMCISIHVHWYTYALNLVNKQLHYSITYEQIHYSITYEQIYSFCCLVATILSLCLPPILNSYIYTLQVNFYSCQGKITTVEMYSEHDPPCAHFSCLILICSNTIQMYACLIIDTITSILNFASALSYAMHLATIS